MYDEIKKVFDSGDAGVSITCPKCGLTFMYSATSYPEKPVCPICKETFDLSANDESCIQKMINIRASL